MGAHTHCAHSPTGSGRERFCLKDTLANDRFGRPRRVCARMVGSPERLAASTLSKTSRQRLAAMQVELDNRPQVAAPDTLIDAAFKTPRKKKSSSKGSSIPPPPETKSLSPPSEEPRFPSPPLEPKTFAASQVLSTRAKYGPVQGHAGGGKTTRAALREKAERQMAEAEGPGRRMHWKRWQRTELCRREGGCRKLATGRQPGGF